MAFALALSLGLVACSAPSAAKVDLPAQTDAPLGDDTVAQLQDAVTHAMAATGSPGAIVGVWAPWAGSWVAGLGTTQPGGAGTAVSTDQRFRAAQITRAMTCDVLYAQVERGTVALDDPVTDYVAGVADLTDVTLGDLCDGTSGIGSYAGQLTPLWFTKPDRVWNPHELASYGLGLERTVPPGTSYRDSDAGYVLLGLALEKATGETASALLEEYVFDRLSLDATQLPASAPGSADVLPGYVSLGAPEGGSNCAAPVDMTQLSPSTGYTDSGVVTDIDDLGRYAQSLAGNALVPQGFDRLADEVPAHDGAPSWLTAGGGVYRAGSLVGQYGAVPGYATAAFADPGSGLTVAVVLNNSAAGPGPAVWLAWELAALASKAPAASGQTAPEAGLPWTAQQFRDSISGAAVCPLP
ncbi:serine hydrolase domain-containing protein [Microbacterium sp. BK668]|uniref:serine hydrolase domain-containing protein n=1 Tax=Microbacterium sp. BK668 TaxID=2512118 RepID=UPI0010D1C84F|nr:serine hydrolase domain-containing protein [Microbacterium sp. BK668]TDN91131.1 D-alanyl-D-alanine carboxypeptidase [Microbacterium sp. BK668]